uniref:Uncharacterized protein n=1 Tax=Varanus komodoensis TaxID=61221 RepID=A0A8D2Q5L6_VARKO
MLLATSQHTFLLATPPLFSALVLLPFSVFRLDYFKILKHQGTGIGKQSELRCICFPSLSEVDFCSWGGNQHATVWVHEDGEEREVSMVHDSIQKLLLEKQ